MMTNASTDTAHMVRTARISRRTMYASSASRLVVEGRRVRGARRAAVLGVDLPRRDVAELAAHDAHAHGGRRLAHGADAVLLVHHDLPDLLGDLVSLLGLLATRRAEQLQRLDQLRIRRRLSLLAVAGVPGRDRMTQQ